MSFRAPLLNFSKGEISEELQGRFDIGAYNAGLRQARNVVVKKTGGVRNRPGFRLVAELVNTGTPGRLIPFEYSYEQSYALVMEQGLMRPAAFGGMVVETDYAITAATQTSPMQITQAFHPYAVGDQIYFSSIRGMVELNGRIGKVVTVIDANNYTVDIDGTTFSAFSGIDAGTVITAPLPPGPTPPTVPPVVDPPELPPIIRPDSDGILVDQYGGTGFERVP